MPTRSPGCLTCRQRKIRCDETRPGCKRCDTHGVPCPGYRTDKPGGVEFKDQTTATTQKAKEQYRLKVAARNPSDGALKWQIETPASRSGQSEPFPMLDSPPDYEQSQALMLSASSHASSTYNYGPQSPVILRSPGAERSALYGYFINTYVPKVPPTSKNGHFSFFQELAVKRSLQPALQQGLDAMSLVQMGSLNNDQAILKQAVRRYGNAIGSLAQNIAKGDWLYDDDVLAAVVVLANCELYEEIAKTGQGWGKHVSGSNQLVQLRGSDSLQSNLALLLYSNMRHGSLIYALLIRKAPFMASPEWRAVAFRVPEAAQDDSTPFYDMAIQIPGLLERHDEIDLAASGALDQIDALLQESQALEHEIRDWFAAWESIGLIVNGEPWYKLHAIDDFITFCALCPDRTLAEAYMFPDFLVAYLHSLYWMTMWYLRTNMQSLQQKRHVIDNDWYPLDDAVVPESELFGYTMDLCRCFPFFCEPISSSAGSIGLFLPMSCTAEYFRGHGHWVWLKWVGSVRNNVFVKGLSPPTV